MSRSDGNKGDARSEIFKLFDPWTTCRNFNYARQIWKDTNLHALVSAFAMLYVCHGLNSKTKKTSQDSYGSREPCYTDPQSTPAEDIRHPQLAEVDCLNCI